MAYLVGEIEVADYIKKLYHNPLDDPIPCGIADNPNKIYPSIIDFKFLPYINMVKCITYA